MTKRLKPTWEELKANNLLNVFGPSYVLTTKRLTGYINFLNNRGVKYEIPFPLKGKTFITQEEYENIRISEVKFESYIPGEGDIIDPIVIRSFKI